MEIDQVNLQETAMNKTNEDDSFIRDIQDNLPSSSIYVFFLSIVLAQTWVLYITLYNSRVFGLIITLIINKFVKYGHIKFGSFTFSVLSGKIMLRDFHYITEDFSVRIQYGWIIFKWWQRYIPKDINEDLSHMETRVQMFLDGFQIHVYNKVGTYDRLDKLFGGVVDLSEPVQETQNTRNSGSALSNVNWRDLIPVIKVEMSSGRIIFGNHLVPHSLIFSFEDGHFTYTTKPASTPFDQFMHDATGKAENFKLMFVQSNKYNGPLDEAPRYMGEGFIVLQTRKIEVHFYMDEPGIAPYEPESVELADGETVVRRTYPCLGMDVKCGKNTDINYGPWVDKQRELLWKFFFPADYQDMVPTEEAKPGEFRNYKKFEFMMNLMQTSTIDILFTKDSETQAIHMSSGQGSYVEVTVPWVTSPEGYITTVHGQLLLLDATTSLQYRSLVECETFEFTVKASYPITWNCHQDWTCDFIACKATVCIIFDHKHFFTDLINDWSVKTVPDLYHFVPYTWTINLQIKDFELVLLTNEYNWIDTSSHQPENAHIAFCGDLLDMSLVLPYSDFLPDTVRVELVFKGENAFCRLYLPENNTSRHVLMALSKTMKLMDRNGQILQDPFGSEKKQWRRMTLASEGWIDCWTTSNAAISIGYTYHPMPVLLQQAPKSGDEESLTAPLRPSKYLHHQPPENFDMGQMESDLIAVELEVAPSMLCVYGSLLRNFLHVKENYLGEDQKFTDFEDGSQTDGKKGQANVSPLYKEESNNLGLFDERYYRPFAVTVSVAIHDIHGHLMKNCNVDGLPCPNIMLERLCFEMDKTYSETKLQLLISPAILIAKDKVERGYEAKHLNEGHLGLSGLQVRGHAMFSHEGLPLDSETLEYGWLVEAIIGDFTGKLSTPQLQNLVEFIQTFIMLVEDPENSMERPLPYKLCQHMLPQPQCRMLTQYNFPCPTSEEIKYQLVRLSLDSVNFCLVESGTALNVQVSTVKLSTCNLHGTNTRAGVTGRVEKISLRQFISSSVLKSEESHPELWLESGSLIFGPLDAEAAMALPNPDFHGLQDKFLKIHDKKTKRLWFLWPVNELKIQPTVVGKCGCHGGCVFFGNNRNGVGFFSHRRSKESSRAVLQVSPQGQDPGFGQSLLFRDKLVFDVLPNNGQLSPGKNFTFTRGYMSDIVTPESPGTNITVLEDPSLSHNGSTHTVSKVDLDQPHIRDVGTKDQVDFASPEFSDKTLSPESGSLHQDSLTSPVSETRSIVSRLSSMEEGLAKQMPSISSSPLMGVRRKVSVDFENVKLSGPSISNVSASSPKSWRQEKTYSIASLESERYYSAEEDSLQNTTAMSSGSFEYSILSSESQDQTIRSTETEPSFATVVRKSPRKPFEGRQASDSSTDSTVSYESAATDQSEDFDDMDSPDFLENFSMVDLHGQVNKPITESPILMNCYSGHLTQYDCKDWSSLQPIQGPGEMKLDQSAYSLSSACQSLQYIHSPACLPHFRRIRQGFSTNSMTTREKTVPDVNERWTSVDGNIPQGKMMEDTLLENASITTGVVKLHSSVDITLTPLFLESFKRYAEAVTPTLQSLHPSSIVDGLHSQCLDRLKRQNRLKKGKMSGEDSAEKQVPDRQFSTDSRNQEGEMKTSSIQALLTVSKINICVLQAGLVEEVISFSALDNLYDLTCVSLLALCIDNVECQLLSNSHSCKTLTDVTQVNNPQMSPKKRQGRNLTDISFADRQAEKQLTEVCREEDVGTLKIARIHLQLQRLLKHSNYLDDIHLTAIPNQRSKVLFKFDDFPISGNPGSFMKIRRNSSMRRESMAQSPKSRTNRSSFSRQSSRDSEGRGGTLPRLFKQGSIEEEKRPPKLRKQESKDSYHSHDRGIGHIMFECGLEDIKATAVRRLGFKDITDADFLTKMDNISKKLEDIQNSTKQDIAWHLGEKQEKMSPTKKDPPKRQDATDIASLHSWDSRVSIPSSCSSIGEPHVTEHLKGDASSGKLELNTIWLNFAAPPPISMKRKVDFTRLDWNLLSTATTAINAWLNPADRLITELRSMVMTLTHRTSSVIACIMTNALEVEGIKLPKKSKYSKVTTLALTLQEEPSCQLLTALRRYLNKVGTKPVEEAVVSDTLPQLITIQKGILALTRQWKNLLYMPQTNISFKDRRSMRPYTVKFAMPENGNEDEMPIERDSTTELLETVDERVSLLLSEERSVHQSTSIPSLNEQIEQPEVESRTSSVKRKVFGKLHQSASGTPPTTSLFDSPDRRPNTFNKFSSNLQTPNIARNDSTYSFHSAAASLTSVEDTPPPTPLKPELPKASILKNKEDKISDLYQWMSMQRDEFQQPYDDNPSMKRHDSLINAFGSTWSQDDSKLDLTDQQFAALTSIMQLADAQSLFKPFLQSVGLHVEGVRPSAMMKKFGGVLSLEGKLKYLKIEISDSGRRKGKGKSKKHRKKIINLTDEMPAFLSQDFCVSVGMKDVIDFESKESGETFDPNCQLNFAMHKLEAKPTTLQVNFMINCNSVTQHVDMPLLRLIYQFVTMAENVEETRNELKHNHSACEWTKTHRKQESKGSNSSADTQPSDLSEGLSPMSTDIPGTWKPDTSVKQTNTLKSDVCKSEFEKSLRDEKMLQGREVGGLSGNQSTVVGDQSTVVLTPPQSLNLSETVTIDIEETSSPAVTEKTLIDEIHATTPRCWRTLYHLLELYSTMPEPKTVKRKPSSKLPVIEEEPEVEVHEEGEEPLDTPSDTSKAGNNAKIEDLDDEEKNIGMPRKSRPSMNNARFKQSIYVGETIPLVVFGIAKVEEVKILAVLSGLKLEASLRNVHASGSYREKVKGFIQRKSSESSVTAHCGHTLVQLFEGIPPEMKTVVTVNIDKTQALHTTILRRGKEHNSAMISVGLIEVDIPQHPVVLHSMMTRSSKQISSTLQEFRRPVSRSSRNLETVQEVSSAETCTGEPVRKAKAPPKEEQKPNRPKFLHIHVKAIFQGLVTGASLLPSLKAQHKTGPVTISGMTGKKSHFTVDLQKHELSFKSKPLDLMREVQTTETSLPSEAEIELPPIHMYADYRSHKQSETPVDKLGEGLILKEGDFLHAVAEIGMLEHSLTTDLLNHLVFVQKVFMKEVNELLQKVSGSDQPVPLWEGEEEKPTTQDLLYSFSFRFKGIQITATTPTSSAVRLETGSVDLEVSNRVLMANGDRKSKALKVNEKMFMKAQVNLNLALGQLIKNPMFEEAEPEFQTMAFFKTKIGIRNALQDELIPGAAQDQEALMITLTRPIILAQPQAFDKAVLVWLNYKNAYEYWTEQRMALNTEVLNATRQVIDRIPPMRATMSPASLSTLFLQLTVDDMGICVPTSSISQLVPATSQAVYVDNEPGSALVLTIKSTQISACSSGSLVSKGRFQDFCVRFADDFETSWDDWKPDPEEDPVMNGLVVPEGTYEVCSRTINKQASDPSGNAKWILNVRWEMQGIAVHLNTNVGKCLSALGKTLTALAGEPDEELSEDEVDARSDHVFSPNSPSESMASFRRPSQMMDTLPAYVYDTTIDPKLRFRLIEKEMNEQARVVQDLKQLGASLQTIEVESRKLEELKAIVFQDFRREMLNKLKKQSESRASALKDQLGIGNRPPHSRSKSYGGVRDRKSILEHERIMTQNRDVYSRGSVWDSNSSRTLPSKVQFGASVAYSPPETPDSMLSKSSQPYSQYSMSPLLNERPSVWLLNNSSTSSSPESSDQEDRGTLKRDREFDEEPNLEFSGKQNTLTPSLGSGGSSSRSMAAPEPNIDFELDVKVFIDNGKCVLHPKEAKEEDTAKKQQKREKTPDPMLSPTSKKKNKKMDMTSTPVSAQGKKPPTSQQIEDTVFFLPSIDLKVHYNSKTHSTDSELKSKCSVDSFDGEETARGKSFSPEPSPLEEEFIPPQKSWPPPEFPTVKVTVDDEEEEVVMRKLIISTPPKVPPRPQPPISLESVETRDSTSSVYSKKSGVKKANLYAWLSLQSLPERTDAPNLMNKEMVISPCLLDFLEQALEPIPMSTLQQSKKEEGSSHHVEMDQSYSSLGTMVTQTSFPVDVVVFIRVEPSIIRFNCLPTSRVECLLKVPALETVFSTKSSDIDASLAEGTPPIKTAKGSKLRERNPSGSRSHGENRPRASSTTSCDGGFMSAGGLSFTGAMSDFSLYIFHPYGGGVQRKLNTSPGYNLGSIQENEPAWSEQTRRDMLSLNVEFVKINISRSRKIEVRALDKEAKSNIVRFSAICDIGSAAFKYDMRRLSEILSFPKAWYNRSLARRMFLGDESYIHVADDASLPQSPTEVMPPEYITHTHTGTPGSTTKIPGKHRSSLSQSESGKHKSHHSGSHVTPKSVSWETLVLFAVNLAKLDLHVNMSNVMGNTVWTTQQIKSQGSLSIHSNGHRDLKITAGTGNSHFDSRGGVVGGTIDINDLILSVEVNEDPEQGKQPLHSTGVSLHTVECRLDYMGTSVLMARLSDLDIAMKDEWLVQDKPTSDTPLATTRPAILFAHGDLHWEQFHMMISRSTTPDIIKMVSKIEEFVVNQFTSSRRVLSAFGPMPGTKRGSDRRKMSDDIDCIWDIRHHRHWQRALELVVGCRFSMLPSMIPKEGTILGGNMTLKGRNLTLACFHGMNFKAKSWALFTMHEPYIIFSTESQQLPEGGIHVIQNLNFYIGHDLTQHIKEQHMAYICMLSRGHSMPPSFTSVQEWFHYTLATSDIKGLDCFPQMSHEEDALEIRRIRKVQAYTHDTEMIFMLPSLQLQLKTIHNQSLHEPKPDEPRPVVECSFVTEFEDHIFVAMDAEVILFLHDLILSYIKEKDKGTKAPYGTSSKSPRTPETERKRITDPTTALKEDWRVFECNTWHLEPTVRLLHWASKGQEIDTVVVDYVLQKLGFSHARVTIPKWMQRGFMDPLDKLLSFLIEKLILSLKTPETEALESV
ncbi:bridge-like lipid transfer protein family member 1 isoform X4 [Ostrea edulis]|uniref:bridge-like lipid transfer protein family member 1 isoform X4 n=1 Tax=Ostrea edulis TaxID=37623 RepID=UPI0024AEA79A|nr:bridge-like lipid transfer protein family member 1 isoform X4 [Ostrea edulis]